MAPDLGEYVLATKWSDGDPCDPFFVGFLSEIKYYGTSENPAIRYYLKDSKDQEHGPFRRCESLSKEEGLYILSLIPEIDNNPYARSVWDYLNDRRATSKRLQAPPSPRPGGTSASLARLLSALLASFSKVR